jgi:hypothetical protein
VARAKKLSELGGVTRWSVDADGQKVLILGWHNKYWTSLPNYEE